MSANINMKFRYNSENIPSMAKQMKHEFDKVQKYASAWIKPFVSTMVKREYPFKQTRVITTKNGNRWHLYIFANSDNDLRDFDKVPFVAAMEYTSKFGKGFILSQYFNNHIVWMDFTPHAIMRYRQRYLTERNLVLTFEEQMECIIMSSFCHNLNIDSNLTILMTKQGAFHGDYIGNVWMQFKTFIAYEDAYLNQREVLDFCRQSIASREEEYKDGLSLANVITQVSKEETIMTHKDVTKKMIKKSGMYHDYAHKRNEQYKEQVSK